ncbi:hypothetical protein OfM1_02430 [Lactovum odontotermitis]
MPKIYIVSAKKTDGQIVIIISWAFPKIHTKFDKTQIFDILKLQIYEIVYRLFFSFFSTSLKG